MYASLCGRWLGYSETEKGTSLIFQIDSLIISDVPFSVAPFSVATCCTTGLRQAPCPPFASPACCRWAGSTFTCRLMKQPRSRSAGERRASRRFCEFLRGKRTRAEFTSTKGMRRFGWRIACRLSSLNCGEMYASLCGRWPGYQPQYKEILRKKKGASGISLIFRIDSLIISDFPFSGTTTTSVYVLLRSARIPQHTNGQVQILLGRAIEKKLPNHFVLFPSACAAPETMHTAAHA
jgi:hypothetical protein